MRTLVLALVVMVVLVACEESSGAPETPESPVERHEVKKIFDYDGCQVYRFVPYSGGGYRYYAKCNGAVVEVK
jgi:hypothetical protein